jgi:hypothetical protein
MYYPETRADRDAQNAEEIKLKKMGRRELRPKHVFLALFLGKKTLFFAQPTEPVNR